jgi:hypothetical protein
MLAETPLSTISNGPLSAIVSWARTICLSACMEGRRRHPFATKLVCEVLVNNAKCLILVTKHCTAKKAQPKKHKAND